MGLIVYERALEMIRELGPLLASIQKRDSDLARQLRRSAASVALNIAEGSGSRGGTRRARYLTASGSARETLSALQVAEAFHYLKRKEIERSADLIDEILAMLWGLTH